MFKVFNDIYCVIFFSVPSGTSINSTRNLSKITHSIFRHSGPQWTQYNINKEAFCSGGSCHLGDTMLSMVSVRSHCLRHIHVH